MTYLAAGQLVVLEGRGPEQAGILNDLKPLLNVMCIFLDLVNEGLKL